MDITFEEAFLGVEKEISITRPETCSICHFITSPVPWHAVHVLVVCICPSIVFWTWRTVPVPFCKGKGTVRKQAKIKVKIPAGIDDNQTVVLRGEGEPGEKGGPKFVPVWVPSGIV